MLDMMVAKMADRVFERSSLELERFTAGINNSRPDRNGVAEAAVPWSCHAVRFTKSEVPQLLKRTMDVLLARALFVNEAPDWTPLPVGDEIPPLLRATGGLHMLGLYAHSLKTADYDYFGHPQFSVFGSGIMFHRSAPEDIREDSELKREFPPRFLPGLGPGWVWRGDTLPDDVREDVQERDRWVPIEEWRPCG